jgi:DNA-binding IscR family transcriptional regulator
VLASDPARVCTSKILWSRVREAIVATLEQMTLADLIPTPTTSTTTTSTTTTPKKAVAA